MGCRSAARAELETRYSDYCEEQVETYIAALTPEAKSKLLKDARKAATRHVAHSGSMHAHRYVHPGGIMRATMVLDAQDRGQKIFDSLGVAPPGEPGHPWAGLTKFKLSFGGDYRSYLGT